MSNIILAVELFETRRDAKKFEQGYRTVEAELRRLMEKYRRVNERTIVSRNKREGLYLGKMSYEGGPSFMRTHNPEWALRQRRKGNQVVWVRKDQQITGVHLLKRVK